MPASGYKFPDLSMSEQHNGFQPWLLPMANFSSGMNNSPLYSEIHQLSAQLIIVKWDLAVKKWVAFAFYLHICVNFACRVLNAQLQIQLANMTTIATSQTLSHACSVSPMAPL